MMNSDESSVSDDESDSSSRSESNVHVSYDQSVDSDDDDGSSSSSRHSESSATSNTREQLGYGSDDDHVPLSFKLQRQREAGVYLRDSRQRKAHAKEIAIQRLNKLPSSSAGREKTKETQGDDKKAPAAASKPKKSKHAPKEVSSQRSEFFKRLRRSNVNESGLGVTLATSYKPKDPRVSNLIGHLDAEKFERNYAFLNELREKEIVRLRQRIRAHQTTGSKGRHLRRRLGMSQNQSGETTLDDDRAELKRLEQEVSEMERQQIDRAAKRAVKKHMLGQVEQGRKPLFVSRAKQKQMVLEAKYDEIRKRKGDHAVEKAISRRLKKDKNKMVLPNERR